MCIYGGCFEGYAPNGNGGCIRSAAKSASNQAVACSGNQFVQDGQCVGTCAAKYYPDSITRKCLACSANCVTCFSSSYCVICDTGYAMVAGNCVASTSCPPREFQYNKACVKNCPVGTFLVGSSCFRSCPVNNYYLSQICYISCPTGLRTDEACVNNCPQGTTANNGVCQWSFTPISSSIHSLSSKD